MKLYYQDAERYIYKISKKTSIELPFESGMKPGQVVANEYVELEAIDSESVLITVEAGYSYDGNSGGINTEDWIIPSLYHDIFYQLIRQGLLSPSLRKQADLCMYYLLKRSMIRGNYFARKLGSARARASYLAVRAFGAKYTKPRKIKIKKVRIY